MVFVRVDGPLHSFPDERYFSQQRSLQDSSTIQTPNTVPTTVVRGLSALTPPAPRLQRTQTKLGGGSNTGFDFSAGCTPVVLKGAHCPRGRLGGVFSRGPGAPGVGIRAALEALEGSADGVQSRSGGGGPMAGKAASCEEMGGEERVAKVARLEEEIERLRSENLRWQQVHMLEFFLPWLCANGFMIRPVEV